MEELNNTAGSKDEAMIFDSSFESGNLDMAIQVEKDEYDPRSYLSEVDAVGWATRQKSLSDDTNASDGAVALGDDVASAQFDAAFAFL